MKRKKLLTLIGSICLILVFAVQPFMAACAPEEVTPPPEEEKPTPTTPEPIELLFASGFAPTHMQYSVWPTKWGERVEEATNGRVKIRYTYGGAVASGKGMPDALAKGIADIGTVAPHYTPDKFPFHNALSGYVNLRPGKPLDQMGVALVVDKIFKELPAARAEYEEAGIKSMAMITYDPYYILCATPIKKFEDLEGKTSQCFSPFTCTIMASAGCTTTEMTSAETYTAIGSGIMDISFTNGDTQVAQAIYEVAPYATYLGPDRARGLIGCPLGIAMSLDTWNKLPPDIQEIIEKVNYEYVLKGVELMRARSDEVFETFKRECKEVNYLSEEDVAKWNAACPDMWEYTIEQLEKRGLPGKQFMDKYGELATDYLEGRLTP